jgi:hypothetical protein
MSPCLARYSEHWAEITLHQHHSWRCIALDEHTYGDGNLPKVIISALSYIAVKSLKTVRGIGLMDVHTGSAITALILLPVRYSTGRFS